MAGRYAAFLRAVNLGSTRKAPSAKLVDAFEAAGFEDVATFRTSGNVAFTAPKQESDAKLVEAIEAGLLDVLGFEVPVFLRSSWQLEAIAGKEPFPAKAVQDSKGKIQVALLSGKPPAAAKKRVMSLASERDRLTLDGSELYWLPSGGTQQSNLDMKAITTALGSNTLRTQGTIEAMHRKYFA
jgi:uncharacterized protein (DUF1697 family)